MLEDITSINNRTSFINRAQAYRLIEEEALDRPLKCTYRATKKAKERDNSN
jgi:hypothetical protein